MPRRGGKRKKNRTHVVETVTEKDNVPRSFVFRRGNVGPLVSELVQDMRKVMSPGTAASLKDKKSNNLKDFVHVAGPLGITHFLMLTRTERGPNLKIARVPRGPTLSFHVSSYSLMRQVKASLRRPVDMTKLINHSPLVVLSNFTSKEDHVKLMAFMFQNMFPPLDMQTIKLSECSRVLLLHYDKSKQLVELRHYAIKLRSVGQSRSVKRIMKAKIPNLNRLQDISDFILNEAGEEVAGGGLTSDSEAEDDESTHVKVPAAPRGKLAGETQKSAIRLAELGPRMQLQLVKVEKDLAEGDILYHAYESKTPDEAEELKRRAEERRRLKEKRKEQQAENVEKKRLEKEAKLEAKREKRRMKMEGATDGAQQDEEDEHASDVGGSDEQEDGMIEPEKSEDEARDESDEEVVTDDNSDNDNDDGGDDEDDDAQYYREAVGEEPEEGLFDTKRKRKRSGREDGQGQGLARNSKNPAKLAEAPEETAEERKERKRKNRQKKKAKNRSKRRSMTAGKPRGAKKARTS